MIFFIYYSNWIESDESEQILSLQRILMWTCRLKSWVTHYNCAVKVINQTSLIKEALILARKKKDALILPWQPASVLRAYVRTKECAVCGALARCTSHATWLYVIVPVNLLILR
jgi:hypothetical protein